MMSMLVLLVLLVVVAAAAAVRGDERLVASVVDAQEARQARGGDYGCFVDYAAAWPGNELHALADCLFAGVGFEGADASKTDTLTAPFYDPAAFEADEFDAAPAPQAHALCATAENAVSIVQPGRATLMFSAATTPVARLAVALTSPTSAAYVRVASLGRVGRATRTGVPAALLGGVALRFRALLGDDVVGEADVVSPAGASRATFHVVAAGGAPFDRLELLNVGDSDENSERDGVCIEHVSLRCGADDAERCERALLARGEPNPPPADAPCGDANLAGEAELGGRVTQTPAGALANCPVPVTWACSCAPSEFAPQPTVNPPNDDVATVQGEASGGDYLQALAVLDGGGVDTTQASAGSSLVCSGGDDQTLPTPSVEFPFSVATAGTYELTVSAGLNGQTIGGSTALTGKLSDSVHVGVHPQPLTGASSSLVAYSIDLPSSAEGNPGFVDVTTGKANASGGAVTMSFVLEACTQYTLRFFMRETGFKIDKYELTRVP